MNRGERKAARRERRRSRLSQGFWPSQAGRLSVEAGHAYLFTRDLPLGVFPDWLGNTDPKITFQDGRTEDVKWLIEFLAVGQFPPSDLTDAVRDFVETAATHMARQGNVFFELVGETEPQIQRHLEPLAFGPVPKFGRNFYQVIPKADRADLGRRAIRIPAEKIWCFELPRELGGVKRHRRMVKALAKRSDPSLLYGPGDYPDFGRSFGYDAAVYRDAFEVSVERITKRWGTIPSLGQVRGTTEYFFFARRLAFQKAQALLREHLIGELNQNLKRLGVSQLEVTGLRSSNEIQESMERLHSGAISVREAMRLDD